MKKSVRRALLLGLILTVLCAAALAVDVDTTTVTANTSYTVTPLDADGEKLTAAEDGTYTNVAKFRLNYTATEGEQLVMLLLGDDGVPTKDNIYYIDQQSKTAGPAEFVLYPKQLASGSYKLIVADMSESKEAATVKFEAAYVLGDVDGVNGINATDAVWALQAVVKTRTLTETQRLAADVDKKNGLNVSDAAYILQYVAKTLTDFSLIQ